jgi:hypothetical protein
MIISLPVQITVWLVHAAGAAAMVVATQLSVPGVVSTAGIEVTDCAGTTPDNHFRAGPHCRGKAVRLRRADVVATQLSVLGLYLPPVFRLPLVPPNPPQTIISVPIHTAV